MFRLLSIDRDCRTRGISGLIASTLRSRSTHFFDRSQALRFAKPHECLAHGCFSQPQASGGGYSTRRLKCATGGSFAMRKTRSLAFCQRHEHILIGLFLASGLAFVGRDATSTTTITIQTLPRGLRCRAASAHRCCATRRPRSWTVEPPWPTARPAPQPSAADRASRRASSSARRIARRRFLPGGMPTRNHWHRPACKAHLMTARLIGDWSVVSSQWSVEASADRWSWAFALAPGRWGGKVYLSRV